MSCKLTFLLLVSFFPFFGISQSVCADSSVRISYYLGGTNAITAVTSDGLGNSFFVGGNGNLDFSRTIFKTNSSDIILWSKKYPFNRGMITYEIKVLENGNILCCGLVDENPGTVTLPFIWLLNADGETIWFKKYKFKQTPVQFFDFRKLIVNGNSLFCTSANDNLTSNGGAVLKIDLSTGNVMWSKTITYFSSAPGQYLNSNLVLIGSKLFITGPINFLDNENSYHVTVLNESNGDILNSKKFKFTAFNDGFEQCDFSYVENIGTLGNNLTLLTRTPTIGIPISSFQIVTLDNLLTITSRSHFVTSNNFGQLSSSAFVNNTIGLTALGGDLPNDSSVRDIVKIDSNQNLYFHRKHVAINSSLGSYGNGFFYDNNSSVHSIDFRTSTTRTDNQYMKTGDFSTQNTLECFGKDTNFIQKINFQLTNDDFVWPIAVADRIEAIDEPITTDTTTVQQTLICKEVSICDSIKILGPTKLCVNQEARFILYKNPLCKKYNEFIFDNTMMQVVRREADTAIVLRFTQPYRGKLNALLRDCVLKDSIEIEVTAPSLVKINPVTDRLCPGQPMPISANTGLSTYTWSNGASGSSINVGTAGWLLVTAADNCGNLSKDSVFITAIDTSFKINTNPAPICNYDSYTINIPNNVIALTWAPNSNTLRLQNELSFFPPSSTLYTLQATHAANCNSTKTINLKVNNCPSYIYFPNAFTPNGDGLNDDFKPKNAGKFLQYQMRVYNRYGQVVFSSNQPNQGWNGTLRNSPQAMGSYVWECSYQLAGANLVTKRGMINLLR